MEFLDYKDNLKLLMTMAQEPWTLMNSQKLLETLMFKLTHKTLEGSLTLWILTAVEKLILMNS